MLVCSAFCSNCQLTEPRIAAAAAVVKLPLSRRPTMVAAIIHKQAHCARKLNEYALATFPVLESSPNARLHFFRANMTARSLPSEA